MSESPAPLYRPDPASVDRYHKANGARLAAGTAIKYRRELAAAAAAGVNLSDADGLARYADRLPLSRRRILYAALRTAADAIEYKLKANAHPGSVPETQAALWRLDALRRELKAPTPKGTKAHTWLTAAQVETLTNNCKGDHRGQRDWIVLAVLVGAGLRREELAALTFEDLKTQGKRWVLQVRGGKGGKDRVVPISPALASGLRSWQRVAGGGRVARRVFHSGKIGKALTAVAIFKIVRQYGSIIGLPDLAPHDLRRTYAMLAYADGVPMSQISLSLGHESERTTRLYLNIELNLEYACSDSVPISAWR